MPRSQDDVLLLDLLDRVRALEERQESSNREQEDRERRLVVTLAGIDKAVANYRRKKAGLEPWALDLEEAA